MKKGLHITVYSESPCYGGAEEYVFHLANGFGRNGCRFDFIHDRTSVLGTFTRRLEEIGVGVRALSRVSGRGDIRTFLEHVDYFRHNPPDILHFNQSNPYSQQYTVLAARLAGIENIIATYHLTPRHRTATLRGRMLERIVLGTMRKVIVLSRQNKTEMVEYFGAPADKISIVPNGLDVPDRPPDGELGGIRGELGLAADCFLVVSAGRVTAQKGFDRLLRAMELIDRQDVCAVIAGDGPLRTEFERQVLERGLEGRVVLPGFREDLWHLLCAADIVAVPSRYEGLPLVLIEAMAAGKPVVASNIYGLADVVRHGETGFLVEEGSHGAIAHALSRALEDPGLTGRMGEAARRLYEEHYTARNFHDTMVNLYHSISGNGGVR